MKKFKFTISKTEEVFVEGEDADEARMKIIEDQENYGWSDYVDEGIEVKEEGEADNWCLCHCHRDLAAGCQCVFCEQGIGRNCGHGNCTKK